MLNKRVVMDVYNNTGYCNEHTLVTIQKNKSQAGIHLMNTNNGEFKSADGPNTNEDYIIKLQ